MSSVHQCATDLNSASAIRFLKDASWNGNLAANNNCAASAANNFDNKQDKCIYPPIHSVDLTCSHVANQETTITFAFTRLTATMAVSIKEANVKHVEHMG